MKYFLFLFAFMVLFASSLLLSEVNAQRYHAVQSKNIGTFEDVNAFKYEMNTPDLHISDFDCTQNKVAVSTQWITWNNNHWIETGITSGAFFDGPDDDNIGDLCIQDPIVYYAYSYLPAGAAERVYQELSLGSADIDSLKSFMLEDMDEDTYWEVFAGDLDGFADVNLQILNSKPLFYNIGSESQVNPALDYSSNPNTHFKNYQMHKDGNFIPTPLTSQFPTGNFKLQDCDSQHFVAGNVLDVDCNRPTTSNTATQIDTPSIRDIDTRTKRVTITTNDADSDYLKFYIDSELYHGVIEGHSILSDPLPTTTHNSVSFDYYSQTRQQEDITVRVSDGRPNHDRTVTVSLFEQPLSVTPINYEISQDSTTNNKLIVTFDQKIIPSDSVNDWRLTATVNPTYDVPITSITNFEIPSKIMYIFHDDLPEDTSSISLEYVGGNLSSEDQEYELQPGTSASISVGDDTPSNPGDSLTEFYDDFEDDLSKWHVTGNDRWMLQGTSIKVPDHPDDNTQLYSTSCNPQCEITMIDSVDLTQTTNQELSFWALATSGVRSPEFATVEYSDNGGVTWNTLDSFTSTGWSWQQKSYDLSPYSDSTEFKIRLIVSTGSGGDLVLFDDVSISGDTLDSTPPLIAVTNPTDGQTFLTGSVTVSGSVTDSESGILSISAKLDDNAETHMNNNNGSWSITYDDLSDGTHFVKISATNEQNLTSETFVSFIVDIPTVPARPTNAIATVISSTQIDIRWSAPTDDGGYPITGYTIERNLNDIGFAVLVSDTESVLTTYSDASLDGRDTVQYRVSAINAIGTSSPSNTATTTTPVQNNTPIVTITSPFDGSTFDDDYTIQFAATATDAEDGDVSSVLIWASDIDGNIGNGTSFDMSSLANGIHNITASVADSGNADGSDSVIVTIANIMQNITSSTNSGTITIQTDAGAFSSVDAIAESALPTGEKPSWLSFPHGLLSWNVTGLNNGDVMSLTITYPDDIPADSQYWKVIGDTWVNATSIMGSNDGDDTVTLTITDGNAFDADGLANGSISDPGGIAVPDTAPQLSITAPSDITYSTMTPLTPLEIGTPSITPAPKPDYTHDTGFVSLQGVTIPDSAINDIDSVTAHMGGTWFGGANPQSANYAHLGDDRYLISLNDDRFTKGLVFTLTQNGDDVTLVPDEARYKEGFNQDLTVDYRSAPLANTNSDRGYGIYDFTIHYNTGYQITNDAPELFPIGDTTVTWSVTDGFGRTNTDAQTVTMTQKALPSITAPADITTSTSDTSAIVDIGVATLDPSPTQQYTHDSFVGISGALIPNGKINDIDSVTAHMGGTWFGGANPQSANYAHLGDDRYLISLNDDRFTKGIVFTLTQQGDDILLTPVEARYYLGFDLNLAENYRLAPLANTNSDRGYGIYDFTIHYNTGYAITNDAPELFPIGDTTVTWTVTDGFGRTNTDTQRITVNSVS